MKKFNLILLAAHAIFSFLSATEFKKEFKNSQWPAAITFMVVDYKYNSAQGVKICEVQHGSNSAFILGRCAQDGECKTTRKFIETFAHWKPQCWVGKSCLSDKTLYESLEKSPQWLITSSYRKLLRKHKFQKLVSQPVYDPGDINHYHAICYEKKRSVKPLLRGVSSYPGILVIDEPTYPYWSNKLTMGNVFKGDPILEQIKPVWKAFNKTNAKKIHEQILAEFSGDHLVIKPLTNFLSKGVIAVHKDELREFLQLMIEDPETLEKHPNPHWRYWSKDSSSQFLVEQFIESDPMPIENGKMYDVTYRTTFLMSYEHEQITLRLFDTYMKYPKKPLDEEGFYTEKHCSDPTIELKGTIPPEINAELERQLSMPLMLMFEKMLSE